MMSVIVGCGRIVDNLPITWCYLTENDMTYCSTGFPIGCFNENSGPNKDGCSYLVGGSTSSSSRTNVR